MILKYLTKREWALFAFASAFIIAQVYLDLRIPEYMSDITYGLQSGISSDEIARIGLEMLGCALLSMGCSMCTGYLIANVSSSMSRNLRIMLLDKIQSFSPEDVDRFSVASLITRSTNDVKQVQLFVARALQTVVKSPIMAVWAIAKISGSAWEWTFATALAVVIMVTVDGVTYDEGTDLSNSEYGRTYVQESDNTIVYTLSISNTTGFELPSTGGRGTAPYTLAGAVLILTALGYYRRRRKREGGTAMP